MLNHKRPVMIVGAGPVGLSLALALTKKNIPVEVFEADLELNTQIRASTFHPLTLEMFASWGVLEEVLEAGVRVSKLQYWERKPRRLIAEFDYQRIARDTPYPYRLQLPQHMVTRILKTAVDRSPIGKVHMGHRLLDFTEDGDHVCGHFKTPNGTRTFKGLYLCGADGAHSTVRRKLGIGFEGLTFQDRFLLIGTDLNIADLFPGAGPVCYIFDPQEWVILLNLPDLVRVVFNLQENEREMDVMDEQALRSRVAKIFDSHLNFEIKVLQMYKVHQRVAESFRQGRTLLLGDAAHINNPAGGMGMNSGIHDAQILSERLAGVLSGGSDELLEGYAQERRRYAIEAVQRHTDRQYKDMTLRDPEAREQRNQELRKTARNPATARAYLLAASMLSERI